MFPEPLAPAIFSALSRPRAFSNIALAAVISPAFIRRSPSAISARPLAISLSRPLIPS